MASDLKDVTNKMAAVNVGDGKAGEKSTAASVRAPPNKIRRPRRRAVCSARPLRLLVVAICTRAAVLLSLFTSS